MLMLAVNVILLLCQPLGTNEKLLSTFIILLWCPTKQRQKNLSNTPQYPLFLYTAIKNIWHYYYKLKLSAFTALQTELILVMSTYSAWDLFTACSVVVCSVPINGLQTTKSKQNQSHPCQTTQQTHCAPSSSGPHLSPKNVLYSLFLCYIFDCSHCWAPSIIITMPILSTSSLFHRSSLHFNYLLII